MKIINLLLMCALVSCSPLTKRGVMVDVWESINSDTLLEYEKIGEVACRNEIYMVTKNFNKQMCTDNLRNSAADLGADFLFIEKYVVLPGFFSTGCEMRASTYKKKN